MASNDLTYKGYKGSVEASVEDACLHGRVLFIDDLVTYEAETVPKLIKAFEAAVDRYKEHCQKTGKPASKPYSGTFNVRVGPDLHRKAAQAAHKQNITLNEYVTRVLGAAVEHGFTKVEHVHKHRHSHVVTLAVKQESRIAAMETPSWETISATTH